MIEHWLHEIARERHQDLLAEAERNRLSRATVPKRHRITAMTTWRRQRALDRLSSSDLQPSRASGRPR